MKELYAYIKVNKMHILIGVLLLIFGMFFSMQIKSIQKENALSNRQKNIGSLKALLLQEQDKSTALENLLKDYDTQIKNYENKFAAQNKDKALKTQLDYARITGGLTDVKGSGIEITLDDAKVRLSEGIDPTDTVIHDGQLVEIMNMLKGAGAQAISLNNDRIVAISETQCAGPTVSVNQTRYAAPFVIRAIGNADYLEAKVEEPGTVLDLMAVYGIQISIKKQSEIDIPKYKGSLKDNTIFMTEIGG